MLTQGIVVQDECIETPLMYTEHGISLIRIPPPVTNDPLDISNWNLKDIVWAGKLRFIEKEQLQTDVRDTKVEDKELIVGVLQFINSDGKLFAKTNYDIDGQSVNITHSKTSFRILIDYEDKKIAFGLVFLETSKAQEFSIALQTLRRDAQACIEARTEISRGLTGALQSLHLTQSESDNEDDFGDFVVG